MYFLKQDKKSTKPEMLRQLGNSFCTIISKKSLHNALGYRTFRNRQTATILCLVEADIFTADICLTPPPNSVLPNSAICLTHKDISHQTELHACTQKLTVPQLVKKFSTIYKAPIFITTFIKPHQFSLS
jgi:hypothetical protein